MAAQSEVDMGEREIRAAYDDSTIRVYQAFSPEIAMPALKARRFVPPFRLSRMTWIKPSFCWMMYRCGYAAKPGQEVVLAIDLKRPCFDSALSQAVPSSSHEPSDFENSEGRMTRPAVIVQWDPERDIQLEKIVRRQAIQVGLRDEAVRQYVNEWIVDITNVTDRVRQIQELCRAGLRSEAVCQVPEERPYPVSAEVARRLGMTPD
jgi:uncharacterized protein DUF4291